ncbi:MAG: M48 metallopeptidase family protein [Vulcanimicrobiaceae bacterium]
MSKLTPSSKDRRQDFRNRVRAWAGRIKVHPAQIQVRRMSRKWASCSSRRCVCFAETLLEQPFSFQEYVIVHELLHLRVPNHGKLFKSLLTVYLPRGETSHRLLI